MFYVLEDFLQPDTKVSVVDAAECLDAILPHNEPKNNSPRDSSLKARCAVGHLLIDDLSDDGVHDSEEAAINLLQEFGPIICKLAKQIPCHHKAQNKIIMLLSTLDCLPYNQNLSGKPEWSSRLANWEGSLSTPGRASRHPGALPLSFYRPSSSLVFSSLPPSPSSASFSYWKSRCRKSRCVTIHKGFYMVSSVVKQQPSKKSSNCA